jgi:putative transcriptional regulator
MVMHDYAPRFISIGSFDRRWEALGLDDDDLRALEAAIQADPDGEDSMSKTANHEQAGTKARTKRQDAGKLSPRVEEMVAGLHELCDAIEAGIPLGQVATVRTYRIDLTPPELSPSEVRSIREVLGLSQALFADFLGVGLATIRSWEQGQRVPSALARRFLDEIRTDPKYWREKLVRATVRLGEDR